MPTTSTDLLGLKSEPVGQRKCLEMPPHSDTIASPELQKSPPWICLPWAKVTLQQDSQTLEVRAVGDRAAKAFGFVMRVKNQQIHK